MISISTKAGSGHRIFAAIYFLIFFALLLLMYSADWWSLNSNSSWPWRKLLVLRLAGGALLSLLFCTVFSWISIANARIKFFLICWCCFLLMVFFASWPGYLMSDSVSALAYSFKYPMELWLGFFKPFLYSVILQIFPHVAAITFLQLMFVAIIFAYVSEVIFTVTKEKKYTAAFFLLIATSPAILFNLALLSRDTLFSVIVLWLAAFVLRLAQENSAKTSSLSIAGVLAGLAVALRGDGWFVLVPFLFAVLYILKNARAFYVVFGTSSFIAVLFAFVLPSLLGSQASSFQYKVANTINPLGYVLQSRFYTDAGSNLGLIGEVVNIEKIRNLQTPYEIPYWWEGGESDPQGASPEAKKNYIGHVAGFLRENFGIYIAGRIETFFATTGLNKNQFNIIDKYKYGWPSNIPPESVNIDLSVGRPFPLLSERLQRIFENSTRFDPSLFSGSVIFWNFLPWLVVLLFAACARSFIPGLRLAAILVLTRVPIVFLAAPASQFKYYLSVPLCGVFLLILILAKCFSRCSKSDNGV
jgi:hypothetical protein